MTDRQKEVYDAVQAAGGNKSAAARALGVHVNTVQSAMDAISRQQASVATQRPIAQKQQTGGREDRLKAFRERFDKSFIIPAKVERMIAEWLNGDDVIWAEDAEMSQKCGIASVADWKNYARENSQFAKVQVLLPGGKVLWCRESDRDELQEQALRR